MQWLQHRRRRRARGRVSPPQWVDGLPPRAPRVVRAMRAQAQGLPMHSYRAACLHLRAAARSYTTSELAACRSSAGSDIESAGVAARCMAVATFAYHRLCVRWQEAGSARENHSGSPWALLAAAIFCKHTTTLRHRRCGFRPRPLVGRVRSARRVPEDVQGCRSQAPNQGMAHGHGVGQMRGTSKVETESDPSTTPPLVGAVPCSISLAAMDIR